MHKVEYPREGKVEVLSEGCIVVMYGVLVFVFGEHMDSEEDSDKHLGEAWNKKILAQTDETACLPAID